MHCHQCSPFQNPADPHAAQALPACCSCSCSRRTCRPVGDKGAGCRMGFWAKGQNANKLKSGVTRTLESQTYHPYPESAILSIVRYGVWWSRLLGCVWPFKPYMGYEPCLSGLTSWSFWHFTGSCNTICSPTNALQSPVTILAEPAPKPQFLQ